VVFMGSPSFAVPTLKALHRRFQVVGVFTQPDRPKGRGRKLVPTEVKAAALSMGLPVEEPKTLSSQDTVDVLKEWNGDVAVVVAYGKILPRTILDLPRMGCVNLHASLLPRHRGAAPISSAILAGDAVTGVTTIAMDEGMDTGDILLQHAIPIDPDDTAGSLHDKIMEPGADLVVETLKGLATGTLRPVPQDHSRATYSRLLSKKDGRIQWEQDAEYLSRLVRAVNPWPGAFLELDGETLKVWKASPETGNGAPGRIEAVRDNGIVVGTGDGLLVLEELQAPGKRRLRAREFAMGRKIEVGKNFA
jgi:methionyl-tRNA formyltransferase